MTRWGILGPGRIAHKFVQDLLTLPDAQLYAVHLLASNGPMSLPRSTTFLMHSVPTKTCFICLIWT